MQTSPSEQNLNLGVIGNSAIAALIDQKANIVWGCFPRFDSDPAFCSLIMGSDAHKYGFFSIELVDQVRSEQQYLRNTAILETVLYDKHGGAVKITDFAPRYRHYGRIFHPSMLVRRLECISGMPRITVRLRPAVNKGAGAADRVLGSNHIRFATGEQTLRLTAGGYANLIHQETPFVLQGELTLILGPDEPLQDSPARVSKKFLDETLYYWRDWVRNLALPFEWQDVVVRAAITLKLCSYEETGGVVAALTTSIPEYAGTSRNWDYRFCWLRDAFFVVQTLNRLSAIKTMESYIGYVKNIVVMAQGQLLQPLYGLCYENDVPENIIGHLRGYRDNGPVRFGNQAFHQTQNDSYGSIILALVQSFFDERLDHADDHQLFTLLEGLGDHAAALWDKPDAGLWEYRNSAAVHTYSAAMCWAACDRLGKIAQQLNRPEDAKKWVAIAVPIQEQILERAWNPVRQTFTSTFGGDDLDASLLLLPEIGLLPWYDERFLKTLSVVEQQLRHGHVLFRYRHADDFGTPETSFTICSLWYAQALHNVGRAEEARDVFTHILERRNHLGLLSEGCHPDTGELWGNFPQTYSMVGLIQTALRLSRSWEAVL
ncbi:MAG: glycoside hydrolase family 15 protein [Alphaproteobacteria bacterium]|nr:glycoside hydrolase family 15 protein [Alphaproteobacteria bacterium]